MRCGVDFSLYQATLDDPKRLSEPEIIRRLHEAGFEALDLGTGRAHEPEFYLLAEDWERRVDEIGETAAKHGMIFSQLHLPFYKVGCKETDVRFRDAEFARRYDICMERAYIAGGKLGIPWAVAHCIAPAGIGNDRKETARRNREYYDRYVELGIKNGVGTAFENMIQGVPGHPRIRFSGHQDELIDFVDSYADPMVQICWDFGHALLSGLDQVYALRKVGKRLKCVHTHDNLGISDDHLIPFLGKIDWYAIADVLAEIGYEGELSMELVGYARNVTRRLQDPMAKMAFESCDQVRTLFYEAVERRARR